MFRKGTFLAVVFFVWFFAVQDAVSASLNIVPTGAAKLSEVKDYIKAGAVAVGVGRDLLEGYSYSEITKRIKSVLDELKD